MNSRKPTALVVDSLENRARVVANSLEELNWETVHLTDSKTAIEMCRLHRFNVIFVDVSAPEFAGCDAVQLLRTTESQTATIIACLDEDHQPLAERALFSGADLCIQTPIKLGDLPLHIAKASTLRVKKSAHYNSAANRAH
ncbi:MAG: response regulator [Paracoccaceae bacterium]